MSFSVRDITWIGAIKCAPSGAWHLYKWHMVTWLSNKFQFSWMTLHRVPLISKWSVRDVTWMSDHSVHLAKWMPALEQVSPRHLGKCPHQLTTWPGGGPDRITLISWPCDDNGHVSSVTKTQVILKPTQIHKWQISCVSDTPWFDLFRGCRLFFRAPVSLALKWVKWWYVWDTHFWSWENLCRF